MAKTKKTTFALVLNSRINRFGLYAVYVRIIQDRKVTKYKTPIEVKKKDWNPRGSEVKNDWIRQSDIDSVIKNEELRKELAKVKNAFYELRDTVVATPERIISSVAKKETDKTFLRIETVKAEGKNDNKIMTGFAAERTRQIHEAGGIRNWKKYNGFLNKLEGFLTTKCKKELLFNEITPEFLTEFDAYLHTLHNSRSKKEKGRMLHQNTIVVNLNIFRTLIRRAMELGYVKPDMNPFLSFKYSAVKTEKEKLDLTEINALKELELEKGSLDWHSLNCFLLSFYCAGIRAGDLLQLRWINVTGGRLNYQMGKNHKVRDLKLVPQAEAILDLYRNDEAIPTDYIFPFLNNNKVYATAVTQAEKDTLPSDMKQKLFEDISSKNALINKSLKRIAEKAGISKKVSLHISRHSFASVAKQKGIDNNIVKSLLAHSRLQTTEGYMGNFSNEENDHALEEVFGNGSSKKEKLLEIIQGMSEEEITAMLSNLVK